MDTKVFYFEHRFKTFSPNHSKRPMIVSMSTTLTESTILFDMKAAFPSVAHEFLWFVLFIMGIPREYINLLKKLYKANQQRIKMFGRFFVGPVFRSGVKQGDPLSMLLFAIAIEPLIRVLESLVDLDEFVGAWPPQQT